jgi:hypothetical protein
MRLLNHFAESLQVKVFENEEELNAWFKKQGDTQLSILNLLLWFCQTELSRTDSSSYIRIYSFLTNV